MNNDSESGTPPDHSEVVTVFASGDPSEVIMAKLLLEADGVRFAVVGEGVQDMFGVGRMFGPFNALTGPVQIRVTAENAELALEILAEMRAADGSDRALGESGE